MRSVQGPRSCCRPACVPASTCSGARTHEGLRGPRGGRRLASSTTAEAALRPTPRFLGALILAAAVFYYGGSSNVAWLYLLAYWIVGMIVVAFSYSLWNRGLTGSLHVRGTES